MSAGGACRLLPTADGWAAVSCAGQHRVAYARGEQPPPRPPVRLYVMGQEAWRNFDAWPPPGYPPQRFHLQPGGALALRPPDETAPDRYATTRPIRRPRSAGCAWAATAAASATPRWRPARTCSPTPPPR
ncbi:MAG: CocE/NonD family hydrolase C-terminal non-catalytic domain-containing protein [Streptosporangiaceae bacterium]